jgi:branched-chain amino acid transport system permease protein
MRPVPPELRGLRTVTRWLAFGAALGIAWVLAYPWIMSPSQTQLGTSTMVYGMIGLSLLVLTGWAGQISLGQMAFAAVGAWVAIVTGWPFVIGVLAGALAGAAAAVVVGIPALRLRGLHLAITTLAFGFMGSTVLIDRRFLGGHLPASVSRPVFLGLDLEDERVFYYFTLAFLVLMIAATAGMRRSRTARALIASRDNEAAAQTFGINLTRVRLGAFAISGFMAAFSGGLLGYAQHGLDLSVYSAQRSLDIYLATVIGGMGSIAGPLLGAGYRGLLQVIQGSAFGPYFFLLLNPGMGVIFVFLVMPGGITQAVFGMRDAWLRRIADRYRIVVPSLIADRKAQPGERQPIAPKLWPASNLPMFIPQRYRLADQWAREARRKGLEHV